MSSGSNDNYEKLLSHIRQLEEQVKSLSSSVKPPNSGGSVGRSTLKPSTASGAAGYMLPEWERPRIDCIQTSSDNEPTSLHKAAEEFVGENRHTRSFEFYGSSSSIALLARVGSTSDPENGVQREDEEALVSSFHNPTFSPGPTEATAPSAETGTTAQPVCISYCRLFMDSFFTTLHYIYPILDKHAFLARCELLWAGNMSSPDHSFVALVYSVLSLGALLRPKEEEPVGGIDNVQWSRKFFEEARSRSNLGMVTDLEMVQCNFFLACYAALVSCCISLTDC